MAFTIGRDGPSYETISEALAHLPPGEQVWMDGSELTHPEALYLAIREANALSPEDVPDPE